MTTNKKGIRIAISGIKGGIGKSTTAMLLGVIAREYYDKKVCLVDCDEYQKTLSNQLDAERLFFSEKTNIAEEIFEKRDKKPKYTTPLSVEYTKEISEESIANIESKHPDCDLFIYDTKGSEIEPKFFLSLTLMDYLILPIVLDSINAKPSYLWIEGIKYALGLEEAGTRNKGIFLLFNKYNPSETNQENLKDWWENIAQRADLKVIKQPLLFSNVVSSSIDRIKNSKSSNDDFIRSISIIPNDNILGIINAKDIVDNIISNIYSDLPEVNYIRDNHTKQQRRFITPETIIEPIEECISFLRKLSHLVKSEHLTETQLHSIDNYLQQNKKNIKLLEPIVAKMPTFLMEDIIKETTSSALSQDKQIVESIKAPDGAFTEEEYKLIEKERHLFSLFLKWLKENQSNNI